MEILAILFTILVFFALLAFLQIRQKQEELYMMLNKNNDIKQIEGQLFEGIKDVRKNSWCYITIHSDFLQIVLKDDTSKKYNILLDKITNFEIIANKSDSANKINDYFLIIRFINKNNGIDVISFKLCKPEYRLVEYVNTIIEKDNAIVL